MQDLEIIKLTDTLLCLNKEANFSCSIQLDKVVIFVKTLVDTSNKIYIQTVAARYVQFKFSSYIKLFL